ncbi:aspartate/glutamate racemase family protein [Martelella soudanensis]|uniref:aspartate/glutamate racemase family protein n=1 Tax=unclassified Martelella TaxID=2629616 RepID=UPI0015DEA42C|nr:MULTISPECIES: aspartate/glutamate racemase family protein [unclassified Martelella]
MIRIALLNPNANKETTARMTEIASETAGPDIVFTGFTAPAGPMIVADEAALEAAAQMVIARGEELGGGEFDGVLISGFGDPGLDRLRARIAIPVTGIAEAGMRDATQGGRRFSIVTTTPRLKAAIISRAIRLGHGESLICVRLAGPEEVMHDPPRLREALLLACRQSISEDGAEVILIGGGPLADAARAIAPLIAVPIVEPIAAGVGLARARAELKVV